MRFLSKPKAEEPTSRQALPYLSFYAPYVLNDRDIENTDAPTDDTRSVIREIYARCVSWCLDKRVMVPDSGKPPRYLLHPEVARSSLASLLTTSNFRALVCKDQREELFGKLKDDSLGHIRTELEQFAITLSITFGASVIDRMIWRIYSAYNAQPVEGADIDWVTFHARYPSMWVLLLLQNVALFYTTEKR